MIFLLAGGFKLPDVRGFFEAQLQLLLPVPELGLKLTAVALPWLEILLGGLLLADWWKREVRLLVLLLNGVFLMVSVQAWIRGLEAACYCFGSGDGVGTDFAYASGRNFFLVITAAWLMWREFGKE